MRYRTHGTRLAALLLVAIMALSVFAMPVAADSVSVAEYEVDADDVAGDDTNDLSETVNITIDEPDNVEEEDIIDAAFDDDVVVNGDHFSISDAEVTDTDGDVGELDPTVRVSQGGPFLGVSDRIVVEFDDTTGDDTEGDIEITLDLDVNPEAANNAADYDSAGFLTVGDGDGELSGTTDVSGETLAEITINPGEEHAIDLNAEDNEGGDLDDNETNFDDGDASLNATVTDAHGNLLDDTEGIDAEFDIFGENEVTGVEVDNTEAELEIVAGASEEGQIGSVVGDGFATVENDTLAEGTASNELTIVPDSVELLDGDGEELDSPELDADSSVDFGVELQDGDGDAIEDENITAYDLELELTPGEIVGDRIVAPTDDDASVEVGDDTLQTFDLIEGEVITADENLNESDLTFETTLAGEHNLNVEALPGAESPESDDEDIDVASAEPESLEVEIEDPNDERYHSLTDTVTYDEGEEEVVVLIVDEFDNIVTDDDFYADSPGNNVDVTLENDTDVLTAEELEFDEDAAGENTLTIDADADADADGEEIQAFVGDDLTVNVDNDFEKFGLADGTDDVDVSIHADSVEVEGGAIDPIDANANDVLNVNLLDDDSNLIEHVDSATVSLDLNLDDTETINTQTDAGDIDLSEDVFDGESTDVTFSALDGDGAEAAVTFNSTIAGEYNITGSSDQAVAYDYENDITVEPLDPYSTDLTPESEFVGIVSDDGGEINVELTTLVDEFDNFADYDVNDDDFDISLSDGSDAAEDEDVEDDDIAQTDVLDATGTVNATLDPEDVHVEAETGEDEGTITAEFDTTGEIGTESISYTHEVAEFEDRFSYTSLPQTATVYFNDSVDDVTQYNRTEATYETLGAAAGGDTLEAEEVDDAALINGIVLEADDDARVGHDFQTRNDDQTHVGEVELSEDGYYLLGANFDISDEHEEDEREINSELEFDSLNPSDDLDDINEITPRNAETLTRIGNGTDVGGYEAYWVNLNFDETDDGDIRESGAPELRSVLDPTYDPSDRDGQS